MRPFRDRPIKQKLVIITLVTTGVALLLAGLGNVFADMLLFRGYLRRDLTVLARVIADNSTAALAFNDPRSATETLGALKERSHVTGACMYREGGPGGAGLFAQYSPGGPFVCPESEDLTAGSLDGELTLIEPILLDGRRVGTLVLLYDLGELNERIRVYGSTVLGVFLVASLLAFLLSSRLREGIATPVARLVDATSKVSETGDYTVRAEKLSSDELGVLVDRFNEMLARIQSRDDDLKTALRQVEKERARFHFLAESMPQKIFTTNPNGELNYVNGQWTTFAGLSFDEMKDWGWAQMVHPDDRDANLRVWRQSLETGAPYVFQQRFRDANGNYRWHLSRAHAMRDANGQITMWIGSNTDIHEQKETEEELRRANEDLQQFAYSASHDLQEPIRNVAVYSEVVARRYQHLIDEEGQQFLGFLREGGHRLSTLVSDLLAYTRASMAELSEHPVHASVALASSLATLAGQIREAGAVVTAGDLPEVHMGDLHLQQVFQNLIGNAVKYRAESPPRIHISARPSAGVWCFSVEDNGIGIDPEFKEKIFGIFKRLSHDRRYQGNGIGLAICQRVVERYGGRIWVESEAGKGATFFFTVPQRARSVRSTPV
jgi:PAS domain S-box-containing protein